MIAERKTLLLDSFNYPSSEDYLLEDAELTPNKKWRCVYNGFGDVGVQDVPTPTNGITSKCLILKPQVNEESTSASLLLSEKQFTDFSATFYMRTFEQNRAEPNNWEMGWFLFRYTDDTHHYYFYLGADGKVEIGKKDYVKIGTDQVQTPDGVIHDVVSQDQQQFLFTNATVPSFQLQTWYKLTLEVKGYAIKLWVDDILYASIIDDGTIGYDSIVQGPVTYEPSVTMLKGKIGPYVEDAEMHVSSFKLIDQTPELHPEERREVSEKFGSTGFRAEKFKFRI